MRRSRSGGLLAAAGLALVVLAPDLRASPAGHALLGIGCANIVPVMFSLAGRQTRMPVPGDPAVTTLAMPACSPGRR